MITIEEATEKLLARVRPLKAEEIPVRKSFGRILREDIRSPLSIPPFNKSAMDGYAVKAADINDASPKNPAALKVLEDIPAGQVGKCRLKKGTAARIMTGAPVPAGADTVVMVEDTAGTAGEVFIKTALPQGRHVAPAGEDVKKGDIVYCKVKGRLYTHLVLAKSSRGILIGNKHGHVNGWTKTVYGKVTKIFEK